MKIEVMLTEAVFRRFTVFDILRRRKMWKSPALFAAIMCGSAVICFVMSHVRGAVMLGSVLTTIGLGLPLVYFTTFFSSLKKQIITLGLKRPQHVYTLELTEKAQGIHVENKTEKADYAWKDVHHVYRDTVATYLYMTPARAFLLPDTSLENFDADALWALVCKKVPQDRRTVL